MVAGATAEVAFESFTDFGFGRVRYLIEEGDRCHHHARGAVAALQRMAVHEGLLHGVQFLAVGETLDGGDALPVGLDGEHGAGLDGLAVQVERAGTAGRRIAADVRTSEPDGIPDVVHEQSARLDIGCVTLSVDLNGYLHWIPFHWCSTARPRRRSSAPLMTASDCYTVFLSSSPSEATNHGSERGQEGSGRKT